MGDKGLGDAVLSTLIMKLDLWVGEEDVPLDALQARAGVAVVWHRIQDVAQGQPLAEGLDSVDPVEGQRTQVHMVLWRTGFVNVVLIIVEKDVVASGENVDLAAHHYLTNTVMGDGLDCYLISFLPPQLPSAAIYAPVVHLHSAAVAMSWSVVLEGVRQATQR